MAINLPHWLVEVVDFLGFNWPEIDEDQMREGANHLRKWADDTAATAKTTHDRVHVDIAAVYQSQSYGALVEAWGQGSKQHLDDLVEAARLIADAIDLLAVGVEAMKDKVLIQLGIATGEFLADQAASVATLGLAETALPLLYEVQNRLLNAILQEFENEVLDLVIDQTIGPLIDRVRTSVERMAFQEIAGAAIGPMPAGLKIDVDALDQHGGQIQGDALAHQAAGRQLVNRLNGLSYTTGG